MHSYYYYSTLYTCNRYGEERYEKKEFQARVRQRFAELQQLNDAATTATPTPWHVINAAQTMDEVERDIWAIVEPVMAHVAHQPVGKLWLNDDA